MELAEVIGMKETLERDIAKLISQFEANTRLRVKDIDFLQNVPYTGGFNGVPLFIITVKVEI